MQLIHAFLSPILESHAERRPFGTGFARVSKALLLPIPVVAVVFVIVVAWLQP